MRQDAPFARLTGTPARGIFKLRSGGESPAAVAPRPRSRRGMSRLRRPGARAEGTRSPPSRGEHPAGRALAGRLRRSGPGPHSLPDLRSRGVDGAARPGHLRVAVRGSAPPPRKGQETNVAPPSPCHSRPPRPWTASPFSPGPGAVAITRRGRGSPPGRCTFPVSAAHVRYAACTPPYRAERHRDGRVLRGRTLACTGRRTGALWASPGAVRGRRWCPLHEDDSRLDRLSPGVVAGTVWVDAGAAREGACTARSARSRTRGRAPGRRREAVMPPCAARTLFLAGEGAGSPAHGPGRSTLPPPRRRKLGLLHRPPAPLASLGRLQLLAPRHELCPCRRPSRGRRPWSLYLALEPGIQEADRQSA